ncbi:hypothetical protein PF004_g32109 [Phytophthora fragariae]|uniref:Uncharacterized protein n=1 Tax=Phytophthora fragariae TaxID=53985 RepID=A0A6G0M842_9STRA|nr:hypothetical protein PF004_g32109 [Phytophthora fragariae]
MPRSSLSSLLFFVPSGAAGRRARCLLGASVTSRRVTVEGGAKGALLASGYVGIVDLDHTTIPILNFESTHTRIRSTTEQIVYL